MATSLIVKIISAAAQYAPLTALLQASPSAPFRMYSLQLLQGSVFPAVVVAKVSNPRVYSFSGRMATNFARIQFTIFGMPPGGENARNVVAAIESFLDQFNAAGLPNLPANSNDIVNEREFGIAATQPETFQIMLDAMIFNNETTN